MNCHSTCEEYKEYSDALNKKREIERKGRKELGTYMGYVCEVKTALRKGKEKKYEM
jgi:hypothetical protein